MTGRETLKNKNRVGIQVRSQGSRKFLIGILASFIFQLTLFAAKAAPTILPFTVGAALAANLSTWQPGESVNYFNIYMKDTELR